MRKLSKIIIKYYKKLLSFLYPDTCPFCGKVVTEGICGVCREKVRYIRDPRCMRCGKPVREEATEYCYDCERKEHSFERGYGLWLHEKRVRYAIYQFKYHNRRIYSGFFARELSREYGEAIRRWGISLIIPVPLSKKRRKQRGYNQAELLAKELSEIMRIPVDSRHLVRRIDTDPQKLLDPEHRRQNLRYAFEWRGQKRVAGNVLLIDDIYTTGNTIDSAARVLKRAGAGKVYFLTISIGQGY